MIKVGVIFGGESVEHEISIISAIQAMQHIDRGKYEIVPIYIAKDREIYTGKFLEEVETYSDMDMLKRYSKNVVMYVKDGVAVLQNKKGLRRIVNTFDIALPIVHGTNVEDGTLQGYLSLNGIPFAFSNLYAAAVGQDKVFMKQIFQAEKISVPKYTWFFDNDYIENKDKVIKDIEKIGYPVIVKPARLGSSIGIERAKDRKELEEAIEESIKYDNKIIVEELIPNLTEVNASVLGNKNGYKVGVLEEVIGTDEFLSYQDKYMGSKKGKLKGNASKGMLSASRKIPADISKGEEKTIIDTSIKAARALNTSGVVRIDYLINKKTKEVYINEVNTIPGSLSFYLWEPVGKKYSDLLDEIITIAIREYKEKEKKTYSFDTNILSNYSGTKGMKGIKGNKR